MNDKKDQIKIHFIKKTKYISILCIQPQKHTPQKKVIRITAKKIVDRKDKYFTKTQKKSPYALDFLYYNVGSNSEA